MSEYENLTPGKSELKKRNKETFTRLFSANRKEVQEMSEYDDDGCNEENRNKWIFTTADGAADGEHWCGES